MHTSDTPAPTLTHDIRSHSVLMRLFSFLFVTGFLKRAHHSFTQTTHVRSLQTARAAAVLTVGDHTFTISDENMNKFSSDIVATIIANNNAMSFDRDGHLFRHVNAFLVNGQLPRRENGDHALDKRTLEALRGEATFFGIPSLNEECNVERHAEDVPDPITSFMTIRKYLNLRRGRDSCWNYGDYGPLQVNYQPCPLLDALDELWSPFCVKGELLSPSLAELELLGNSTIHSLALEELVAAATQSPFGKGAESVMDTTVRNSFEILASSLNSSALENIVAQLNISELTRTQELALKPYKLVIYKEGGHFHEHRDTVRGEGHIGTLVVVLNSTYTGGELEVTHGGRTETVTGAYSWVAMYGDCLHKINPVTSGTRVSLIYDIYASPRGDQKYDQEYDRSLARAHIAGPAPTFSRDVDQSPSFTEEKKALARGVDLKLIDLIDAELDDADSLIVTLQHLYPECQTSPAFLKGGDRALYDLLSQHYDVRVVAATIQRHRWNEPPDLPVLAGKMFTGGFEDTTPDKKVKIFIPHAFSPDSVLDYSPYISFMGNEPQGEDTVYIAAGLQLRRKSMHVGAV